MIDDQRSHTLSLLSLSCRMAKASETLSRGRYGRSEFSASKQSTTERILAPKECPFRKSHLDSLAHSTVRDDVEQWGRQGKEIELMTEDRRRCRRVASSFRTRLVSISQA